MDYIVQLITSENYNIDKEDIIITSISAPKSFDEFNINIIDLNSKNLWYYKGKTPTSLNSLDDLKHISSMIKNSSKSINIVLLPQNLTYAYYSATQGSYIYNQELKNLLDLLENKILKDVFNIPSTKLFYENTSTNIRSGILTASFYFDSFGEILTTSEKSNKATTINVNDLILSTIKMNSYNDIYSFLDEIKLLNREIQDEPDWFKDIEFLNDKELISQITHNHKKINTLKEDINKSNDNLNKNKFYKSILYKNGDELVDIVFSILGEILGIDLNDFQDLKKEDFLIELDSLTFIGEIKGISQNLKSPNLSQLELHYQSYLERMEESVNDIKVKPLLIINHQRKKSLSSREPINLTQIELAMKYGSLIIETSTLLDIFGSFKENKITKELFIDLLNENIGILEYNK